LGTGITPERISVEMLVEAGDRDVESVNSFVTESSVGVMTRPFIMVTND